MLAANDSSAGTARRALDELCRIYRYPLYCFVRRAGYQHADADDVIQGFFAQLLARGFFAQAEARKGRLRGFLLASLEWYLRDEARRAGTVKRGGRIRFIPLDFAEAEARFAEMAMDHGSPEECMDRAWALEVLRQTMQTIRHEWRCAGRAALYEALRPWLLTPLVASETRQIAARCELSEENVRITLHRLRKHYGRAIREVVAETVGSEDEIDPEMALLRSALG